MSNRIIDAKSKKILSSFREYTIQTKVTLKDGSIGIASIPIGYTKGLNEPTFLKAEEAISQSDVIVTSILDKSFTLKQLDEHLISLDGTDDKSKLGANTILSFSIAFCKAIAKSRGLETYQYINSILKNADENSFKLKKPSIMVTMVEGGVYAQGRASIQEFMVITKDLSKALEIFTIIEEKTIENNCPGSFGITGGLAPFSLNNIEVLDLLQKEIEYETIGLDIAADLFEELNIKESLNFNKLLDEYSITYIEDACNENDVECIKSFSNTFNKKINVCLDNFISTSAFRLQKAIDNNLGNTIVIKLGQASTVSECLETIKLAKKYNWETVVTARGIDTNDSFIADLAIGSSADFTKFGSLNRGERTEKYNRLNQIIDKENL